MTLPSSRERGKVLKELNWLSLSHWTQFKISVVLTYKAINSVGPAYLTDLLPLRSAGEALFVVPPLEVVHALNNAGPYIGNAVTHRGAQRGFFETHKAE